MQVRGGPGAYEAFLNDIRRIFGITEDHDMHLAFDCADPVTGNPSDPSLALAGSLTNDCYHT